MMNSGTFLKDYPILEHFFLSHFGQITKKNTLECIFKEKKMVLKTERNVADVMDTEGDENRCCLCMDLIECWAIGKCKHPV